MGPNRSCGTCTGSCNMRSRPAWSTTRSACTRRCWPASAWSIALRPLATPTTRAKSAGPGCGSRRWPGRAPSQRVAPCSAAAAWRGAGPGAAAMAIYSHGAAPRAAAAFVAWLHSAKVQRGLYASAGGQPGNLAAWRDRSVNAMARDFFAATLTTLEAAWVRPRFAGIVAFVEAAGGEINRCLRGQTDMCRLQRALTALYHQAWAERGQALSPALKHAP